MDNGTYDIITVGGGIGGSTLAISMARKGARVLVVERERDFKDRVRGEWLAPWGVAEAKELDIYDLLVRERAQETPGWDTYIGPAPLPRRDFPSTTIQHLPSLTFYHPDIQELLLQAAKDAGAEVRRSANVRSLETGSTPQVTLDQDGRTTVERARLIVGADGRSSTMRAIGHFEPRQDPQLLCICGVLLENLATTEEAATRVVLNPSRGSAVLLVPVGPGRVRAYYAHREGMHERLRGQRDLHRFIEECIRGGAPREWYAGASAGGPLASFDGADSFVEHPFKGGIALIGDAASASDPTHGQGLSLTLRDVRSLRDQLLRDSDWGAAGHLYAMEHDRYYDALHKGETWFAEIFFAAGAEAEARRERALPLIAQDPSRVPDTAFSGPDIPMDDFVRRRFYGEE
jgi:menaquinone-9 beta-reductase